MPFLDRLLTSRVRARLLTLFFMHPDEAFYLKGLVRLLGENNNALRLELTRLEQLGLLTSERRHGRKEYRLNQASPVYPELRGLILKTDGVAQVLREALAQASQDIEMALLYGSFAQGTERAASDIDLLLVGDVDVARLRQSLRGAEHTLGREVNEVVYDADEFQRLEREEGSFVQRVLAGPTIALMGGGHVDCGSRAAGADPQT